MKFVVEALGLTDGGAKAGLLRLLPLSRAAMSMSLFLYSRTDLTTQLLTSREPS